MSFDCSVWSNFEIADMDFWRGEAYTKFFEFLDSKGGFYYEVSHTPPPREVMMSDNFLKYLQRWGDAPVHSIAAALFMPKEQLHFFRDIGYRHEPFQHCPKGDDWVKGKCSCNSHDTLGQFSRHVLTPC